MSHVLIGGGRLENWRTEELLAAWGMTLGRAPGDGPSLRPARVHECDVLIWHCPDAREADRALAALADAAVADGGHGLAPVLLLGACPAQGAPDGERCRWLAAPGPRGALLKAALLACIGRARSLRGHGSGEPAPADHLHFLGHELRSPLTAVQTALEVLQTDLAEVPDPAAAPAAPEGSRRMLEIALRNVRRLHQAVEWSHGMMLMAEAPPCPELQAVDLAALGRELQALHPGCRVETAAAGGDTRVHCDPGLVAFLAAQAARALAYAGRGDAVQATLGLEGPRTLRLALATLPAAAAAAPVERTRLVGAGPSPAAEPGQDLLRLVRMLIPTALLDSLGAELEIDGEAAAGLILRLPLGPAASPAEDPTAAARLAVGA